MCKKMIMVAVFFTVLLLVSITSKADNSVQKLLDDNNILLNEMWPSIEEQIFLFHPELKEKV